MRTIHIFGLLLWLFVSYGCCKEKTNSDIIYSTISEGNLNEYSKILEKQDLVISSQKDFDILKESMSYNGNNITFKETEIDFSKNLLLVTLGDVKQYQSKIYFSKITEKKTHIEAIIIEEDNGLAPFTNRPYHIVKIPITSKKILFKHTLL